MIQFYAPDIETTLTLPESDSRHAVKVLRMTEGDELQVINGRGSVFHCRLVSAHPKHAFVEILSSSSMPLPWNYSLTVAVAPTKHLDRMEWLVEKLTEIGINHFQPVLCNRSERRELKIERLEKIAISAMKQSLKAVLPDLQPMKSVRSVIEECTAEQRFICYCDDAVERRQLARELKPNADAFILIGPEGDFTPEEVEIALAHGFIPVTLGENRLRTETAALYAASTVHIINELD